ncbi:Essential protein Yae1, N-terminal [Thalictrum thalictroides]|uniref:Essential protein Yae1, N-terminal n=1 Tax=Thalictrum thalictroides TaxID=46969 RepID=A0A7J6WRB9_THATH|nr:Essential protein Yae1, N-terminal [Thalictrum thalictroides]
MEETPLDAREDTIPIIDTLQHNDLSDGDGDNDFWGDDGSICNESNEVLDTASDLEREWQRRHNQFHTIGYRDGLTAGKETSAQEGFNDGFKQSVIAGYKWGIVRGVTSALVSLPSGMKEKLVEVPEMREKLQDLYESVHSVSTQDALKEFHAEIVASDSKKQSEGSDLYICDADVPYEISSSSLLGKHVADFEFLKLGSFAIGMNSAIESQNLG